MPESSLLLLLLLLLIVAAAVVVLVQPFPESMSSKPCGSSSSSPENIVGEVMLMGSVTGPLGLGEGLGLGFGAVLIAEAVPKTTLEPTLALGAAGDP